VISLSPRALSDLRDLLRHYETLDRIEASTNLLKAIEEALSRIGSVAEAGLPAPRPYKQLASLGLRWLKCGPYWISYTKTSPPVIAGVFHATADIPNRI
jgi:plasmid stabilization system protein ParE